MDILWVVVLSVVLTPVVLFTTGIPTVVVGVLYCIVFPGYTLTAAVFPRKETLSGVERLALSFGLSFAVVPVIGLILNIIPAGITVISSFVSILSFILITAGLALYRRHRLSSEERFELRLALRFSPRVAWDNLGRLNRILTVVLALVIFGTIGVLVYTVQSQRPEAFTEFEILGPGGEIADYPQRVALGEEIGLFAEITNHEYETTVYNVQVEIDGRVLKDIGPIVLDREEKWQEEITFTPTESGPGQKVDFKLFREDSVQPYLNLHIWIDVQQ